MIWAVLFGYLVWSDAPDGMVLGGAAIVIASGLYVLRRETRAPPLAAKAARAAGE